MTTLSEPTTHPLPADGDAHLGHVMAALIVGGIAAILDSTMVTIALHTLVGSLHTTVGTIQWVTTGYLLALAVAIPLSGWVQARLGGRRAWMTALAIFIVGSVLCAVAWNDASLIGFRVLQGLGGGLIVTLLQTLAVQAAGGRASSKLIATMSMPLALGPILGPVIGGVILSGASWRWLFLVNVPIVAVGLGLAWRWLPADRPVPKAQREPLDVIGLALLGPGLTGILLGLSDLSQDGGLGHASVLGPLGGGLALLAAFAARALHATTARPIVDIRMLRLPSLRTASAALFTAGTAMYAGLFLLPLYYQGLRHDSVLAAGLLLVPQGIGSLAARFAVPRLVERCGARAVTVTSFLLVVATTVPFALVGGGASLWALGAVLLVRGCGLGAVLIPPISVAYDDVPSESTAHATMNTRIAQQLGASFGTAIVAVVLQSALAHGQLAAFHAAFWWAAGIALVAVVPALTLPGRRGPAAG